jgi:hypothetical protein
VYEVTVKTGADAGAGTNNPMTLIMEGTLATSDELPLVQKGRDSFERGNVDT